MASIPNISGSVLAANNQNIAGLVNFNLDLALIRCNAPIEFSSIGPALSLQRRKEAEGGQQHKLACILGLLFNDIIPDTPKLIKAFGTRASDILRRPGMNPRGTDKDGPFRDFVGADGTSIWAAATSNRPSLGVYLLACMLARKWEAKDATAIWAELVDERKRQVQVLLDQGSLLNPYTQGAAAQEFNRRDLARWDASVRSWLRRADHCTEFQHTQFKIIIESVKLPFFDTGTTFEKVTKAWIRSMTVLETLLGNKPQVAYDRSVLVAISSWHLYPDLLVFQEKATNVPFSDDLFPPLGRLSLGFEYHAPARDVQNRMVPDTGLGISTQWSLALSHLRYYGSPVKVKSDETQGERASVDEIWLTCLGAILRQWEVSLSNLEASVQWFQKIGDLIHPSEEKEKTALSWLSKLCQAAGTVSCQDRNKRQERMRFVSFGWRKDTQLLGYHKALRPPFFGLCNTDVLNSLGKKDGTEIGFEFFRRLARRLDLLPENAIICRSKEDRYFEMGYEWATIGPVKAGLDGASQPEEDDTGPLRNARWIYVEDSEGRTARSSELQQRQDSIQQLGERCHVIHHEGHIPRKNASKVSRNSKSHDQTSASLHEWPNPPPLFDKDEQSVQFVQLQTIPMPQNSAGFGLFVRRDLYENRLGELEARLLLAVMDVDVQESLNWLEAEGHWFDIVGFLMGFFQGQRNTVQHGRRRFAGKKRKRSLDVEGENPTHHHAGLLDSDNGRRMGCYYTVGIYRELPTEWIKGLRALEVASVLYEQLPGATISLRLINQELYKAKWLPWEAQEKIDSFNPAFTAAINTSVHDLCKNMTRSHSFACIAMMESGKFNLDTEHTEAVVALCSDNSIFVAGILLSDPTTDNLGMNIRHLIGNIGHAGIVLMIAPNEPAMREPTYDASMIDHNLYDGKHIDSFKGTSLHLSFTQWEMPLEWYSTGDVDQQLFLLESVISVQDNGRWIADLDVLALEKDSVDILQFVCDCDRSKPPTNRDIASLDSWEELLDSPPLCWSHTGE